MTSADQLCFVLIRIPWDQDSIFSSVPSNILVAKKFPPPAPPHGPWTFAIRRNFKASCAEKASCFQAFLPFHLITAISAEDLKRQEERGRREKVNHATCGGIALAASACKRTFRAPQDFQPGPDCLVGQ